MQQRHSSHSCVWKKSPMEKSLRKIACGQSYLRKISPLHQPEHTLRDRCCSSNHRGCNISQEQKWGSSKEICIATIPWPSSQEPNLCNGLQAEDAVSSSFFEAAQNCRDSLVQGDSAHPLYIPILYIL